MSTRWLLPTLGIILVTGAPATAEIKERKLVDLTYSYDEQTIQWPTNRPFHWEKTFWGMTPDGYWYTSADFAMSEHSGTHMDAPVHFGKGQSTVDEIPIQRLVRPAVVVDVTAQARKDRDYRLAVSDLTAWEARHGRIAEGAIVLMYSGWGQYWPDKKRYLGSDTPTDAKTLHFPGFSKEAAEFLVKDRKIDAIGIDTPSIDHGPSLDFIVHRIVNGANLYALENVANLDQIPPKGATLIALPMKIKGGTGGPVRIIAILP